MIKIFFNWLRLTKKGNTSFYVHYKYLLIFIKIQLNTGLRFAFIFLFQQARENAFRIGLKTWSGPNHILGYNHAKSAALVQVALF